MQAQTETKPTSDSKVVHVMGKDLEALTVEQLFQVHHMIADHLGKKRQNYGQPTKDKHEKFYRELLTKLDQPDVQMYVAKKNGRLVIVPQNTEDDPMDPKKLAAAPKKGGAKVINLPVRTAKDVADSLSEKIAAEKKKAENDPKNSPENIEKQAKTNFEEEKKLRETKSTVVKLPTKNQERLEKAARKTNVAAKGKPAKAEKSAKTEKPTKTEKKGRGRQPSADMGKKIKLVKEPKGRAALEAYNLLKTGMTQTEAMEAWKEGGLWQGSRTLKKLREEGNISVA